jgi:hypothetical protein
MIINGNLVGFGMFVAVAVIIAVGSLVLKLPNPAVMISAGAVLIAIDLVLRCFNRKHQGWLMGKQFGGYLFFAPVWIFGIIIVVANIISVFVNKSAK